MNACKTTPTEAPNSTVHRKLPNLAQNVRATAHAILCSFSNMLTEREKIVLHSLSQGLSASEIAERLKTAHHFDKSARKIRGGARSLSLIPSPGTSGAQGKIS